MRGLQITWFQNYMGHMVHLTLFVYYLYKLKKYKSMTCTKVKLYIILIKIFFPIMNNNKNYENRGGPFWEQEGPAPIVLGSEYSSSN